MTIIQKLLLPILLFFVVSLPCTAQTINLQDHLNARQPYLVEAMKRIAGNWEPADIATILEAPMPEPLSQFERISQLPAFTFSVGRDGSVSNITTTRSTGIAPIDLACEDAILSCSPFPPMSEKIVSPLLISCDFSLLEKDSSGVFAATNQIPATQTEVVKNLWRCGPSGNMYGSVAGSKNAVWWFHAIPMDILVRYPDAMKSEHIHAFENLRKLDITKSEKQLVVYRNEWSNFFSKHESATASELIEERKRIDGVYDWLSGGKK